VKLTEVLLRLNALEKEVVLLRKENAKLKELLSSYENPKNSRNSSIPPSKDENRPKKNQSLRKSTGKKPGGQLGRTGKTLEMSSTPDQVIDLVPDYCNNCGSSLEYMPQSDLKARQIVDIPMPKAVFTEYRSYAKICACGCQTRANFPEGVCSPISYGATTESLIAYFHTRQYLPFARMKEMFNDVFNTNISEGGLHYILERFARKTDPIYDQIKERITNSKVVGVDETGARVGGEKNWFWTWQNDDLTYIVHSKNRGYATIDKEFPNGLPSSVIVRDGWRAQAATPAAHHQMCLAHLQRSLNYLNEKYKEVSWGIAFSKLLESALVVHREDRSLKKFKQDRSTLIHNLEKLLDNPPEKQDKQLYTFYKSMARERQNLFTFLYIENVPPDNNGSERAVRNIKVKQKISGQFKVNNSAQNFAQIRSVIDTTLKNGLNVLKALTIIANLVPLSLQTD
jgi:transposase